MRRRAFRLLAALLLAALPLAGGPAAAGGGTPGKPQRIASLNLCADELLLRLVEPERVASVTWLARDPGGSGVAAQAAAIPVNQGLAEEIVPLRPDLVIVGAHTTRTAAALVKRLGVPLLELDMPRTVEGVAEQIRRVAEAVGEPERGEALVAGMMGRFAALDSAPPERRPGAVVLRPNGFVAGSGSLVDTILERAGLENLADRLPLGSQGALPLEAIILGGAERLIVDTTPDAPPSLGEAVLLHPAILALAERVRTVSVPSRLWSCATPEIAEAAERLAAARKDGP